MESEVAESALTTALAVPTVAAVPPARLVPVIVTTVPAAPLVGVKLVMTGRTTAELTAKLAVLVPVPPGVVTEILPVVAPTGTAVRIDVADMTVKGTETGTVPVAPIKSTLVAPVKLVPVRVTLAPIPPVAGLNVVTVGTGMVTV